MTRLRKRMPEELDRRNYSPSTARCYLRTGRRLRTLLPPPPRPVGSRAHPPVSSASAQREKVETDSNYASVLSLWDRLWRTYRDKKDCRSIRFGLDSFHGDERQSLSSLLLFRPGTRKFSPHFSPADGRSTR